MIDAREDRIRARAHAIWEGEGRPHGRDDEHWQQASREFGEGDGTSDPSARSLGSAAQSDLIPEDAGQGAERAGSLVDTGPAIGLAAGTAGTAAGLGNLSLGQEVGHGEDEGSGEPGGLSSIGSGSEAATGGGADNGSVVRKSRAPRRRAGS
jgi:hypothetical protein